MYLIDAFVFRYGDPLRPNGDLNAMNKMKCVVQVPLPPLHQPLGKKQ